MRLLITDDGQESKSIDWNETLDQKTQAGIEIQENTSAQEEAQDCQAQQKHQDDKEIGFTNELVRDVSNHVKTVSGNAVNVTTWLETYQLQLVEHVQGTSISLR